MKRFTRVAGLFVLSTCTLVSCVTQSRLQESSTDQFRGLSSAETLSWTEKVERYASRPLPPVVKQGLKPIKVEQPCFPTKAIKYNAQGWVQVEFSLNENGQAFNVVSLDNSPPGLFESCALSSIRKWVFEIPETHHPENRYQFVFHFKLG
ncbi:energy transducer TonB [Aliikangiella coralliicola]|uniref:TonB C-terminal domain-containing protein n=1 Tax=Aliikangiella coralliicola TaxID=2592383 RepID=A0A545U7E6_9GAMM|nr:energy transducer TonB [Aliikangiella coralliicola]TQV85384.1 hypothetical protein FLL46_19655 [Aliikangiella coralliicola]